ncbi:MAG TPA: sulfatase [Planctomycetota bacterium]|nr:sulfatase [Planctomycetota bacterium]
MRVRSVLTLLGMLLLALVAQAGEKAKLNVLFIVSDDLNTRLGCYGDSLVKTPYLDKLAGSSVRFERAYCQYPLCNPSRASFLTGLRPDSTGVKDNAVHFRKKLPDCTTLPQTFQKAGYTVMRIGKLYHYGVPAQIGTDGFDDPPSWQKVFNPRGRDKDDENQIFTLEPGKFGATLSWLAADGTDEEQTDGIGAREAIRFLEQHTDKPFFLALGFFRPHTPYVAPKKYFDMYPLEKIQLPERGDTSAVPPLALASAKKEQDAMNDDLRRKAIQAYFASISFMDAQLGRVLDALERLKLSGNTVVVFFSDHGYHLGEHGLWQKMSVFEESLRVPLVIHSPGAAGNGQPCMRTVELVDLHPTLAELCGLPAPAGLDGRSLVPLLKDPKAEWNRPALSLVRHRGSEARSVRTERWRYTEWDGGSKGVQLYDHEKDPVEQHNLAGDPNYAKTIDEIKKLAGDLLKTVPPAK